MSSSLVRRHQNFVKRSQQYTEEKNTFLRCKDLRVSRDLKEINTLREEINWLLSKGMSNIYFKVTTQFVIFNP